MKRLIFFFLCTFGCVQALPVHAPAHERGKPATIKILVKEEAEGALLEVKGSYKVINPENGKSLSSGRSGKRFYLFAKKDGLKWGENYPGIYQIRIVPLDHTTTMLINGIQYRGALEIYLVDHKLSVINELDVETYLKSTLGSRLKVSVPAPVLDAIAIVERTNAYYTALVNHDAFYHVRAEDVNYQGYGLILDDLELDRAIDDTRYLIMTYDAQPFATTWTENCAGRTASYHSIFRKNTTTPQGVISRFAEKDRKDFHWTYAISSEVLAKLAKVNRITGIELFHDHKSGKIYGIRVKDGSHAEDIDFSTFQKAIGQSKLLSNDFTAKIKGDRILFEGYGKGIGVGLCLYSASQMAEAGEMAPKMLAEFYPYTHVEKMRSYPEMIISPSKEYFISPKGRRGAED